MRNGEKIVLNLVNPILYFVTGCLYYVVAGIVFFLCRPFWLSPRQAIVVPVGPPFDDYARQVTKQVHQAGYLCDTDLDLGTTMNKKIRNAQLAQYNFIFGKYREKSK